MMLRIAIIDANQKKSQAPDEDFVELVSVVSQWLRYEIHKAGLEIVSIRDCDILLLVHSGELDWRAQCTVALQHAGIEVDAARRCHQPYIITGGAIDTSPFTALKIADGLAVGEAYRFVRELLDLIKSGADIPAIQAWMIAYPYAIERSQIAELERDTAAPWLLKEPAQLLATPDEWIDWGDDQAMLSPGADDRVDRIIASKGCHLACRFCATTFRQTYRVNPNADKIREMLAHAKRDKRNIALITNDAAALPFYQDVVSAGQLRFQSMTVKALRNPHILDTLTSNRMKNVRFGVEGVSERIRIAYGKPVSNTELLHILARMREARQLARLFFIAGSPYEAQRDWNDLDYFLHLLSMQATSGMVELKFTAYNPQAPTPMTYFISSQEYYRRFESAVHKVYARMHVKHFRFIRPRSPHHRISDACDVYDIPHAVASDLFPQRGDRVTDLAPSIEQARRMPWEIIKWPVSVDGRWKLSRSYQKQMMR